jgi:hypothetical protein
MHHEQRIPQRPSLVRQGCETVAVVGSACYLLQFIGAVGVEDQVVDQAEFEALEDDFGSDGSYG